VNRAAAAIEDLFVPVADGLTLHVRDHRPAGSRGAPVVCLPGMSRTLEDFDALAVRLAADGRRTVSISARGRGLSDRDPDPSRYQLKIEAEDALLVLDRLEIERAHVIGTSRGGLQAMMIGALRPAALRSVVLNDIGPVVETDGLRRIRDSLADVASPVDFAEAAAGLAKRHGERFPALRHDDFEHWARRAWRETPEGLEPASDPALLSIFDGIDLDQPGPPIWPLFDTLAGAPLMVVRGEFSDILSEETVALMKARRPVSVVVTAGQGHAPLLDDEPTLAAIAAFLDGVEG